MSAAHEACMMAAERVKTPVFPRIFRSSWSGRHVARARKLWTSGINLALE
jgi:hypothetical protein